MSDIRNTKQVKDVKELLDSELDYFSGIKSGGKTIGCQICNGIAHFYFTKNSFELFKCEDCEFLFAPLDMQTESIAKFFENSKAVDLYTEKVIESEVARRTNIFGPLARKILDLQPDAKRVLEIGCGAGLLLDELKNVGNGTLDIEGVEINRFAANKSKLKGHKVFQGPIEEFNGNDFDVVIFWAFLDHIPNPLELFKSIKGFLVNGGMLIFGNANYSGFETKIMGPNSHIFSVPERLSFFTPKTLETLCAISGFKDTKIEGSGSLDLEIVKDWWDSDPSIEQNEFLYGIMQDANLAGNFTTFLQQNLLTSHLTITSWK